jgi:hypothetical protein
MALIVEDGTAKADAESLCSVSAADAYHAARGRAAWAALDTTAKEQNLRLATEFMGQAYRLLWAGTRVSANQALDWPRAYAPRRDYLPSSTLPPPSLHGTFYYPADVVPADVVKACAELALKASNGTPLMADRGQDVTERTVGPITTKFANGSRAGTRYAAVEGMLSMFFKTTPGGARVKLERV